MDRVSTPPGFVSQTSFVLKHVSREKEITNLSDEETFKTCLWSRPWILHDQAALNSEASRHEVTCPSAQPFRRSYGHGSETSLSPQSTPSQPSPPEDMAESQVPLEDIQENQRRTTVRLLHPNKEGGALWFDIDKEVNDSISESIKQYFDGLSLNWSVHIAKFVWSCFMKTWNWDSAHSEHVRIKWKAIVVEILKSEVARKRYSKFGGKLVGSSGASPPSLPSRLSQPDAPPLFKEDDHGDFMLDINAILNSFNERNVPIIDPDLEGALWFGVNDKELKEKVTNIIKAGMPPLYYCWTVAPEHIRRGWWLSFIQTFRWKKMHTDKIFKEFNQLGMQRIKLLMNNAKRKYDLHDKPPEWATEDLFRQLVQHWSSEHFKEKSAKAKQSRLSQKFAGDGPHRHTSGAKSFKKRAKEMEKEIGRKPTLVELVARTHKRYDGSIVDPRAERIIGVVTEKLTQLSQASDGVDSSSNLSPIEQDICYVQVYNMETSYLQDPRQCGNVLKGYEGFLSSSKNTALLKRSRRELESGGGRSKGGGIYTSGQ
ncbi:PREDICTED: uncharacterized protein LOC104825261 [Tarenaya hassleriana]|uniref:uncharacterized protein LOC104825261 n=1 Tax=Tarenaya hassleriana TaxID=28532 RepID=UPI00053C886F|nr:PREDICTED: uncharacterized protein LOC104825261 [Tarenaya hassleriana]